ncbi:ATP-binding protein [Bradyrhizobium sp. CCBAU 53421]|uniref:ATP-binding protein n=1 Tax=Bradyrhizobium sp. CCBAU 53421 TaxID=1325120 RepID=UPI00188C6B62|nr:ATP-binding protein [Bradyrhizobium sp. CCBAU 53421]QOZ35839.1 PAS domain S-box protein [Bradyrhizobium sp. CCBAU 53421]
MRSSVVQDVQFPKQPALQLIYDTAPIGLAYLSPDCRYLQINQRLTEICGISVEGHLGRTVHDCVPALATAVEGIVRSIMETGEPVTDVEVYGQRPGHNDERCWITHWHPQREPNGSIVGVNVAAEEITDRKRSEREIRAARDAAEKALHHLQETQASLIEAEKLAALGRLVAGVAHEINSPVGTSLTVASVLEQKCADFAAEAARGKLKRSSLSDFIEVVESASSLLVGNLKRAADLVQSFKQVAVDRSYFDRSQFDLGEVTEQVLSNLRPALPKNNLALEVDCPSGLAMNSYPGPYGQALTNLFVNSVVHAFPDGKGGTITIRLRALGADQVEILFADDGCGMSRDVLRQAFDPFFTTRRDVGRIGLGLHIVHNIVTNRLGGELHLDSAPGIGTGVRITLPRLAPQRGTDG